MRTDKSDMIVISHFKLYPALFPLKWLICIPNISAVRVNVVFETLHDFYRTAIIINIHICCYHNAFTIIESLHMATISIDITNND